MINDIKEINFPSYATLREATITKTDMGECSISATIKIDGQIVPDFSFDWLVEYKGERFVLPLKKPQASKENSSLSSVIELTFVRYAEHELKRYFFAEMTSTETGTAIVDRYEASLNVNLKDFIDAYAKNLKHLYGDSIVIELNPNWQYDLAPQSIEISYSLMWDVLVKLYEVYGVRWDIVTTNGKSIIKVGYDAVELSHIFEYGFEGGLLKVERQVQSEDIRNVLLGRGGEKNLPYRYFKDKDPNNPSFRADPDWIPELKNVYFANLRGKTFRDYVKGWKTNPNRQLTEKGQPIKDSDGKPIAIVPYNKVLANINKAYKQGHEDTKFNPIEYIKADGYQKGAEYIEADDSIKQYGELWGGLENNEDIFPTIQGVVVEQYGRVDESIAIEQIETDDVEDAVKNDTVEYTDKDISTAKRGVRKDVVTEFEVFGEPFTVPTDKMALLTASSTVSGMVWIRKRIGDKQWTEDISNMITIESTKTEVIDYQNGEKRIAPTNLGAGKYRMVYTAKVRHSRELEDEKLYYKEATITLTVNHIKRIVRSVGNDGKNWGGSFNIWIKNIWQTTKASGENDTQYAERVWQPILGDRLGEEAKVVFSSGFLSVSEDYEFPIVKIPELDTSKTLVSADGKTYQSYWKLTLKKSDADYDSLGLYVPSTTRQGKNGDYFFFVGIDMPQSYVEWAEQKLDDFKVDSLDKTQDIKPNWNVLLDKIRISTLKDNAQSDAVALIDKLDAGCKVRLKDNRFLPNAEWLYIQSITKTYRDSLIPDVEITLSDKVEMASNPVSIMQGEIETLNKQIGSISNVERMIRIIGDKLYLRKDGLKDNSISPTTFGAKISSDDFRQGSIGGKGWGVFRDGDGNTILEIDKITARKEIDVNELVINQISVMGGKQIESAASIVITNVMETTLNGQSCYICYFDNKQGSIANLFEYDDIAFSQSFDVDNTQTKYYKRLVLDLGQDFITLSNLEGEYDGTGIPQVGDVVCHYGNISEPERQYVKVKDVIGGGYERYLEKLDSVNSEGVEYFFVGRQVDNSPRFFIGERNGHFIEWKDGVLNIKGALSVQSMIGGQNYALGTWKPVKDMTFSGNLYDIKGIKGGTMVTISFDAELKDIKFLSSPAQGYAVIKLNDSLEISPHFTNSGHYSKTFIYPTRLNENSIGKLSISLILASINISGYWKISNLKVECGDKETSWSFSPYDANIIKEQVVGYDYLTKALEQDTTINGGLIQTSLIKLGEKLGAQFTTKSGISGLYSDKKRGKGLAFWAGGDVIDKEDDAENGAMFGVRMDGTAYASGNVIKFNKDNISVGDVFQMDKDRIVGYDENGSPIIELSREKMAVGSELTNGTAEDIKDAIPTENVDIQFSDTGFELNQHLFSKAYAIKAYKREATISIYVSCLFPDYEILPPSFSMTGMTLLLEYLDATNSPIYSVVITPRSISKDKCEFNYLYNVSIEENKGHRMRITLRNSSRSKASDTTQMVVTGQVNYSSKNFYSDKTLIGLDGLQSFHKSGYMIKNSIEFVTMFNSYGLKVDATGIYSTKDGGISWQPLVK